jgi:isopentenyl-diphosphate delta-isomerase type 1
MTNEDKIKMNEEVILVNEQDQVMGTGEKLFVHKTGQLHRAFSVFLYRRVAERSETVEWLLQQRSADKYHCGSLWTNSCCSHPRPNESILDAAERRLWEELRLSAVLWPAGHFIYRAPFDNGLIEHEFDHVLIGECAVDTVDFNSLEIQQCRWLTTEAVLTEYALQATHFTPWFMLAFRHILDNIPLKQELKIC